jgi:hypothetical protein
LLSPQRQEHIRVQRPVLLRPYEFLPGQQKQMRIQAIDDLEFRDRPFFIDLRDCHMPQGLIVQKPIRRLRCRVPHQWNDPQRFRGTLFCLSDATEPICDPVNLHAHAPF